MDPVNLTYEQMISIVTQLGTSFRFGSLQENQFRCLIFIIGPRSPCHAEIRPGGLPLLDKKSRRGPESAAGLLTTSVQSERT
ncbi:hypothetical protein ACTXT7_003904 [Hymenolepis weldensis]